MTLPDERYRAVVQTRRFLLDLCNKEHTPRVPKLIRDTAKSMLRHFPTEYDMQRTARMAPDVFAEQMDDLHKMIVKYSQETVAQDPKL
jgi:hypothetical protein